VPFKALGLVHEIARLQHDSLASLIARSATQGDQAHARLLQSIEALRSTGEGWWEEVRRRVQEQLDLDVVNARTVMDVQVAEMRGLVSGADDELQCGADRVALNSSSRFCFPMWQKR
jgi:hypothetical protein